MYDWIEKFDKRTSKEPSERGFISAFTFPHSNFESHNARRDMPRGTVHMQDSEKTRNWHQNVLIHHLLGDLTNRHVVSHTPQMVMFFGVLKAVVPLGVCASPKQRLCPVISLRFLWSHGGFKVFFKKRFETKKSDVRLYHVPPYVFLRCVCETFIRMNVWMKPLKQGIWSGMVLTGSSLKYPWPKTHLQTLKCTFVKKLRFNRTSKLVWWMCVSDNG